MQNERCHFGEKREALHWLLISLFPSPHELRRFILSLKDGPTVSHELPGPTASLSELTLVAVDQILAHGLVDSALFRKLVECRGRRKTDIERVSVLFEALPSQMEKGDISHIERRLISALSMVDSYFPWRWRKAVDETLTTLGELRYFEESFSQDQIDRCKLLSAYVLRRARTRILVAGTGAGATVTFLLYRMSIREVAAMAVAALGLAVTTYQCTNGPDDSSSPQEAHDGSDVGHRDLKGSQFSRQSSTMRGDRRESRRIIRRIISNESVIGSTIPGKNPLGNGQDHERHSDGTTPCDNAIRKLPYIFAQEKARLSLIDGYSTEVVDNSVSMIPSSVSSLASQLQRPIVVFTCADDSSSIIDFEVINAPGEVVAGNSLDVSQDIGLTMMYTTSTTQYWIKLYNDNLRSAVVIYVAYFLLLDAGNIK